MKFAFTVATPDTADPDMLALRGDLTENFRLLSSLGYSAAELMVRDPSRLSAPQLRQLANDCGLKIPAVSTGQLRKEDGLSLADLNPVSLRKAIDRMRSVIDFAAALGAQVNIGSVRGRLPSAEDREKARSTAAESLALLSEYAASAGVNLAIEPQCRYVINWLNTVEETLRFLDTLPGPKLGILFDLYHVCLEERSVPASMIRAASAIRWVQVSDSNRLPPGGGHWHFGDPIHVLQAFGYDGYISVECKICPNGAAAATQAIANLRIYTG